MDSLLQDLRFAIRTLARSKGFTAVAVLCLALGIGVNTAIFSMVNALLLRPFPFPDPDRVVSLYATNPKQGVDETNVSLADLADWRARSAAFTDVAGMAGRGFVVSGGDEPERVEGFEVSDNLFRMIGAAPLLGRGFLPEEGRAGGERVAVLGHALWQRRFGASPGVVGQKVLLSGTPHTVVGVMPRRFKFPETAEVWVPLVPDLAERRSDRDVWSVARLKPGVTVRQAQEELDAVARRLAAEHPATNAGWGALVLSFRDDMIAGQLRAMLYLMVGAVGFVLLIACANVANLLLARATARSREMAVRVALGASRARVMRQLLTESVLVAVAGGALGVLVAAWWKDYMLSMVLEELPYWIEFSIDQRVLAYTLLLSVTTGVVFGLVPAVRASRPDLQSTLKDGGRGGTGGQRGHRLRGALVAGEVALSLVLLVGAGLMVKSFLAMSRADAGFDTRRMLTMRTSLAGDRYAGVGARGAFLDEAARRMETLPGVRRVAATTAIPADDGGPGTTAVAEGQPKAPGEETLVSYFGSTPGLFDVLEAPLVAGRAFTAAEAADSAATAVIVNQTVADRFWPGESALGKRLHLGVADSTPWLTVVGVARALQYEEFGEESAQSRLQVHLPYARLGWRSMALLLRTEGDPAAVAPAIRRELRAMDPTLPSYDVRTFEEVRRYTTWPYRLYSHVFASFGVVAVVLAAAGVYGVMAYAVAQRAHELGVRVALGAQRGDLLRLVVGQGARLTGAGVAVGLVGAFAVSRALQGLLYGVSAMDAATFVAVPIALAAVALLASYLPARRAARVSPMVALRAE